MYEPNIVNGVLTPRFDEIKTHLNHQLSFSPNSNQGHILVDNQFYDFEVNEDGDLFSPEKLDGYDYYNGKSYLGHYNQLQFTPNKRGGTKAPSVPSLYALPALPANRVNNMKGDSKPAARAAARPAGIDSDMKQDDFMTRVNNSKTNQVKRYMELSKKKKGNNNEIAKQTSPRLLIDKDMVPRPGPDDEQPTPSNYNEYSPYKFSPSDSVVAAEGFARGAEEAARVAANAEIGEDKVTEYEAMACSI